MRKVGNIDNQDCQERRLGTVGGNRGRQHTFVVVGTEKALGKREKPTFNYVDVVTYVGGLVVFAWP